VKCRYHEHGPSKIVHTYNRKQNSITHHWNNITLRDDIEKHRINGTQIQRRIERLTRKNVVRPCVEQEKTGYTEMKKRDPAILKYAENVPEMAIAGMLVWAP
jgi:hypothetical protein